jgi:hypothetical protein
LLRNGWYTENYTGSAALEIAHGAVMGSTGAGRISSATRAGYAAGAAAVLAAAGATDSVYELAGDDGFTLADYVATLSDVSGPRSRMSTCPRPPIETPRLGWACRLGWRLCGRPPRLSRLSGLQSQAERDIAAISEVRPARWGAPRCRVGAWRHHAGGIYRFAGVWRHDTPPGPAASWQLHRFAEVGRDDCGEAGAADI